MTYVSAFDDDALGEFDATGVANAIRTGAVSRLEVVEAAIARTLKPS
jgi:amidase